jgi:hypothetical protein
MFGAGLMFVWILKWMSRNAVVWLPRLIRDSLSHQFSVRLSIAVMPQRLLWHNAADSERPL